MRLTGFAIHHNVAVLVLCVGILVLGTASYLSLPRESFPDVELPYIMVTTVLDGADPTDVEESVTIPLETELDGIEGLKEMRSHSADGISLITLEFAPDVNKESALNRVRDAVDQAKPDLATEADEPTVQEVSVTSFPILIYHLVGSGTIAVSELNDLAEKLEDRFKTIPGVLDVDIFGARAREIVVEVDPRRLHFYDLTLAQVQVILLGTNRNVSAGSAESARNRVVMRVPGEFKSAADIMGLVLGYTATGTPIYLRNVAGVRYDFEDEDTRARLYSFATPNTASSLGRYVPPSRSVSIHIMKRAGENLLDIVKGADEILADAPVPPDVRVIKGVDHSKNVRQMVGDLENGIGTSLILVVLVILVGLGFRNAILVAAAIPFSLLLSMVILQMFGQTLNMMVLFSLILALGMLVDNAIVIVENIYRHYSMGAPRFKAAYEGTAEVAWPVITSTATTVGAFLPLVFWPGVVGEFMGYLPRTVIIVLLCSLFVALVINPTLAAMVMRLKPGARAMVDPESQRPRYWLVRRYQVLLEFVLDRPAWTLCTTAALLVLVLTVYRNFGAGTEFFPPIDPDEVVCSIEPPEGVSLAESDRLSRNLEDRLFGAPDSGYEHPVPNLRYASVVIGRQSAGGFGESQTGPIRTQIEFVDRSYRTEPSTTTLQTMRRRVEGLDEYGNRVTFPLYGADHNIIKPETGPPTGAPVSIDVFGTDLQEMAAVIRDMKRLIAATPGTVKPTDDAETAQPTLEWRVDRARAGMVGLDQGTISSILQVAVGGLKTGTFGHGDAEQDVMLRLPKEYRLDTTRLRNVTIPVSGGGSVPLASVAAAKLVPGPVMIKHLNKTRVLTAQSEVQPQVRNDSDIRTTFQESAARYTFPPGISYQFGGAAQEEEDARQFLGRAFTIALFTILVVLVLQFNSLAVSGIVLCSVVLSVMGVFLGLLILQAPFGIIMTGIGVISLAGVVVNNAIVLLDAIRRFERQESCTRDAVISAAMVRFRPVLLTAITTILGLVPMALKLNWDFREFHFQHDTSSSQLWQSMALAVIFGLLVATILTLGVVPTLYLAYSRARANWKKLRVAVVDTVRP